MVKPWEWELLTAEAARYILRHPCRPYKVSLLRLLFPIAPVLDNLGISSKDVRKRIDEWEKGDRNEL